ncbi:hypothetical protein U1Q18_035217 [Sarracenia purpurea var. burkii]
MIDGEASAKPSSLLFAQFCSGLTRPHQWQTKLHRNGSRSSRNMDGIAAHQRTPWAATEVCTRAKTTALVVLASLDGVSEVERGSLEIWAVVPGAGARTKKTRLSF